MHPNHALLDRLFTALDRHDHAAIAACYAPDARFRDIAFDLRGREGIHDMWRMICSSDIRVTFQILHADDYEGSASLVETYTFGASEHPLRPGRRIRNEINSRLTFAGGLIASHDDDCDARVWPEFAVHRHTAQVSRSAQAIHVDPVVNSF